MKLIFTFLFIGFGMGSMAQLYVGASYGNFHVREGNLLKGSGVSVRVEYVGYDNEDQQLYLDASFYRKSIIAAGGTEIYDNNDMYVGTAVTTQTYDIKHIQLGFKRALAGNFTDSKFNFFLGAGGALSFIHINSSYNFPGFTIPDDQLNKMVYGFHFSAGAQWHLDPVIIELRGSFDFLVKPIMLAGGDNRTYFLSANKLGITYPITKKMKRGV